MKQALAKVVPMSYINIAYPDNQLKYKGKNKADDDHP